MAATPPPDVVKELIAARDTPRLHRPLSEQRGLTAPEAYALQDQVRETLIARGERLAGWKAALTTRVTQEFVNYSEPISGFLLASGVFPSGAEIPQARFANLVAEAEIAFLIRRELAGPGVTPAQALLAVEGVLPALELPDLRYSGKPTGPDMIADGAFANAIVLGGALTSLAALDLALEGLVYELNGVVVATNTGAEVMGNPLNALTWLANHLGERGLGLKAGDVVMSGSVSKLLKPAKGDTVRATYTRLGSVSVRLV